jgi:ELWxxDGT repeat protein/cysteine-rich repeat protein
MREARRRLVRLMVGAVVVVSTAAMGTVQSDGGPAPSFLRNAGGRLYFATYEPGGWRVWTSDGTVEGTVSLADSLGLDVELVAVDDTLVFSTRGALWKSDGTGTGPVQRLPFYPNGIKSVRREVYFSSGRGELWKSDLTAAGTVLVKDIPPGSRFHDLTPAAITNVQGTIFFRAVETNHGSELWTSDGTADGTTVIDVNPGSIGSAPGFMLSHAGSLYFSASDGAAGNELWRSDGPQATARVKDINPAGDSWPLSLRSAGKVFFFSADDGVHGVELWKSDGSRDGTVLVADVNPTGGSYPVPLLNVGGTMYLRADDGTTGVELWRSDGTLPGTARVADVNPTGSSAPANLRQIAGRLFFTADDGIHGEELWTSDGTAEGTLLVADLDPVGGSQPRYLLVVGDRLYFAANDGTNGTQLWTLDCDGDGWPCTARMVPLPGAQGARTAQPYLVKDVNPGPGDGDPYYLTAIGNLLFFHAHRPDTGLELWTSDGTEAGTRLVRDLNPGPADSYPHELVDVGGTAFFVAESAALGSGLWRSDGTEAGTVVVHESEGSYGQPWALPSELTPLGDRLYYAAGPPGARALWRTDGTPGGAELVRQFWTIGEIGAADGAIYVLGVPVAFQRTALWRFDAGGGTELASLPKEGHGQLTAAGGLLFFRSNGALWRSDGTSGGTHPLPAWSPRGITRVGSRVFFSARSALGAELWTSDGTYAGTRLVADIDPAPGADGMGGRITDVGGTAFFWATDGRTGFELWKSDGTAAGTRLVRDIDPTDVTVPSYFQAVGNLLYFTAHTPSFGYELWRSDGTFDGTYIVKNLNPVRSSYPESPAVLHGTLFFYADDGRFGDELWALTPCGDGVVNPGEACDDGNLAAGDGCSDLCRAEAIERCDNCLDDDGNGLVDLEDPACCAGAPGELRLGRVSSRRQGRRRMLELRALLDGVDLGDRPMLAHDLTVQLDAGGPGALCGHIPAERLTSLRRSLVFNDPRATLASAGGVTRVTIRRRKAGGLRVGLRSRLDGIPRPGDPTLRLGFGANGATRCALASGGRRHD